MKGFIQQFSHPKYWLTWLGFGVLWVFAKLPYPLLSGFGVCLGEVGYWTMSRRRHIARTNINLCFKALTDRDRRKILRKSFHAAGVGVLEIGLAWWASDKKILSLVDVDGLVELKKAYEAGQGVILLVAHFTTLEILGRFLPLGVPYSVLIRRQKNKLFDAMSLRCRNRYMQSCIIHDDPKRMLKALRQGEAVAFLPDQDYGIKNAVFVPFFGVQAATVSSTAKLARFNDARIVPTFCYRQQRGKRYRLVFQQALRHDKSQTIKVATAEINRVLEEAVLVAPDQYLWGHRRFKSRPEGEASVY